MKAQATTRELPQRLLQTLFGSFPEIVFLQGVSMGVVLFVILLISPHAAMAGVLSVLSAYLFARFINMEDRFLESGYYTYNPLLVGLAIGHLYTMNLLSAFMVVCAGVLTVVVTIAMVRIFWIHLKLPILSLPFVLVSSMVYLASQRYSNLLLHDGTFALSDAAVAEQMPFWLVGFCRSLGAVFLAPHIIVGVLLSVLIVAWSRILFLMAAVGYLVGTAVRGMMMGSFEHACGDVSSYNFILIAMALGAIFLLPCWRSYALAAVGVATSALLQDSASVLGAQYGLPVLSLPFNVVSLTLIYVLKQVNSPLVVVSIKRRRVNSSDLWVVLMS